MMSSDLIWYIGAGMFVLGMFYTCDKLDGWLAARRISGVLRADHASASTDTGLPSPHGYPGMAISGTDHHRDPDPDQLFPVALIDSPTTVEPFRLYHQAMSDAKSVLMAAQNILDDRDREYGSPDKSFARIATLWSAYLDIPVTATDVAMMMALLKIARIKTSPTDDSYIDLVGYSVLASQVSNGQVPVPEEVR